MSKEKFYPATVIILFLLSVVLSILLYRKGNPTPTPAPITPPKTAPTPKPPTTQPTTPQPPAPTVSTTSTWRVYANSAANYEILYPADFTVKENTDLSQFGFATGTEFVVPNDLMDGTNLVEGKIAISKRDAGTGDCFPVLENQTALKRFDTPTITFFTTTGDGVGAGNRYQTIAYATMKDGFCYDLDMLLHSGNIGMYDPSNRPREFDYAKFSALFEEMVRTFKFTGTTQPQA